MGDITNGCSGIYGGVDVSDTISTIEGLLQQVDDIRRNADIILHNLKIVMRDVTGYLDESTLPRVSNPNFIGIVKTILNGVREVLNDKTT